MRTIGKPKEYIRNLAEQRKAKYAAQDEDVKQRFKNATNGY